MFHPQTNNWSKTENENLIFCLLLQVLGLLLLFLSVHLQLSLSRFGFLPLQSSAARSVQRPNGHRPPHHHQLYVQSSSSQEEDKLRASFSVTMSRKCSVKKKSSSVFYLLSFHFICFVVCLCAAHSVSSDVRNAEALNTPRTTAGGFTRLNVWKHRHDL